LKQRSLLEDKEGCVQSQNFTEVCALFMQTAEEGASTVVHLAFSSKVEGVSGGYYKDSRPTEPSSRAEDPSVASRLWAVSQELTLAPDFETSQSVPTRTAMWLMPT
jgi:hypothetical protein